MMKRADRKVGFLILFLCELVGWPATFLSLGETQVIVGLKVNHCCRHIIYTSTEAQSKESILVPFAGFHFQHWFLDGSILPLSSKTIHVSCTNAVIGVVLCWLGVFAWVFREWHSLVLESGFRMTCLHGNEQKLHPRLCWNHDFSRHMRLGEFLAQHAFTMLDHKHGRVATLFCRFDATIWWRLPFDSPPDGKTFFLGREDCRTTCKMHQSPCKYIFILSCSPTRTFMLSFVMYTSFWNVVFLESLPNSKFWSFQSGHILMPFVPMWHDALTSTPWVAGWALSEETHLWGDSSGLSFPVRSLSDLATTSHLGAE